MSEEPKKQKRSRPKSEVVKSSDINREDKTDKKKHSSRSKTAEDGEAKKTHSSKKSHRSEKPAVEDRSAEIEQLKKDLEAANARIATLQQENESLTNQVNAKKEESSSSSSDNNNQAEEISSLKAQLEDRNNTCSEQERTIESLRNEISNLRADHEKALEAEFEKLAAAQKEIRALQEKNEELQKPKPIQGTKVTTQPSPTTASPTASNNALSPRGQAAQGNIPAWKQRELEKQREAEEARQAETRAKLQKVASLRATKNDIHTDSEHKNFKDPLENKPSTTHGGVVESSTIVTESISPALTADLTEEEKAELEMARLAKTLKRGGHSL